MACFLCILLKDESNKYVLLKYDIKRFWTVYGLWRSVNCSKPYLLLYKTNKYWNQRYYVFNTNKKTKSNNYTIQIEITIQQMKNDGT